METTEHVIKIVLSIPTAVEPLPPVEGPLTLSISEAGKLLGISRALAYELVHRGEIPSIRLGGRIVVPRKALVAMVDTPSSGSE